MIFKMGRKSTANQLSKHMGKHLKQVLLSNSTELCNATDVKKDLSEISTALNHQEFRCFYPQIPASGSSKDS